jgi:hypothetical protein
MVNGEWGMPSQRSWAAARGDRLDDRSDGAKPAHHLTRRRAAQFVTTKPRFVASTLACRALSSTLLRAGR